MAGKLAAVAKSARGVVRLYMSGQHEIEVLQEGSEKIIQTQVELAMQAARQIQVGSPIAKALEVLREFGFETESYPVDRPDRIY